MANARAGTEESERERERERERASERREAEHEALQKERVHDEDTHTTDACKYMYTCMPKCALTYPPPFF